MKKLGCLGLVAILFLGAAIWAAQGWKGAGPAEKPIAFTVPQGATLASAAERLEQAGAIPSATRFRLQARVFGGSGSIKAGEYEIPAGASASQILDILQTGKALQRVVVVPEGLPSVMVRDVLMKADTLTGDVSVPAEGSVLPDGYAFERGETRAAVLARMQGAMRRYLADIESLDDAVGRILKRIDELGLRENTIVVFNSDQGGDEFSHTAHFRRGRLHENGIRVPLIVRWPGVTQAGQVSDQMVTGMDLSATIIAAAGAKRAHLKGSDRQGG